MNNGNNVSLIDGHIDDCEDFNDFDDYEEDDEDDDHPCVNCSSRDSCDCWDSQFCCTLCHYYNDNPDCSSCDPSDI